MHNLKMSATMAGILGAFLLSTSASMATGIAPYSGPFYLSLDVTSSDTFTDVVIFTSNPPASTGSSAGQFTIGSGTFNDPFVLPGASYNTSVLLLGINSTDNGLALFSNSDLSSNDFNATFTPYVEANLINDLITNTGSTELNNFAAAEIGLYGFTAGSPFYITGFSTGFADGTGTSSPTPATPLPSTWTMLIAGFVGLGFFAYRGSKKNTAAIASA